MVTGNRPITFDEWLRRLDDRIRRLEQRRGQPVSIGPWVISVDSGGQLVARHVPTGVVRVLAVP